MAVVQLRKERSIPNMKIENNCMYGALRWPVFEGLLMGMARGLH
jgi:hypothetical protein